MVIMVRKMCSAHVTATAADAISQSVWKPRWCLAAIHCIIAGAKVILVLLHSWSLFLFFGLTFGWSYSFLLTGNVQCHMDSSYMKWNVMISTATANNNRNQLFSVCPDPVDKYLEETSVRYISPRGAVQSKDSAPHRRTGGCLCVFISFLFSKTRVRLVIYAINGKSS